MMIGLKPFELTISKEFYCLYILGIIYGKNHGQYHCSLGFSFSKERKPDRSVWKLNLACYWWHKHITVKTTFDGHYCKCNLCGGLVWKHNRYCPTCGDELYAHDVTFIYRNSQNYRSEINELREAGHKVAVVDQFVRVKSTREMFCTPREFRNKFPDIELYAQYGYENIDDNGSLWQVNIDQTLSGADIPFEIDESCDYVIE